MTFILLAIGAGAGLLSGLFGIGGGIVIVPALIYFAKLGPQQAVGTSLGALMLPIGAALGALSYWRAGQLDIKASLLIAAGMVAAVPLGTRLAQSLEPVMLKRAFAVLLVFVAYKMFRG